MLVDTKTMQIYRNKGFNKEKRMLGHDAKIYKNTYALSSYLFKITAKFQDEVKATLAKRMEDAVLTWQTTSWWLTWL